MNKNIELSELDTQHWKPSPIFPERYLISDNGEVYNIETQRRLKGEIDHNGYVRFLLHYNGKKVHQTCHRLVAMAFIPNPDNKPQVDHINGDKTDNRVENLSWCSCRENMHNPNTLPKLKERGKKQMEYLIRTGKKGKGVKPGTKRGGITVGIYKEGTLLKTFNSQADAAEFVGVCSTMVALCVKGKRNQAKGYTFKRLDNKL